MQGVSTQWWGFTQIVPNVGVPGTCGALQLDITQVIRGTYHGQTNATHDVACSTKNEDGKQGYQ